MAKMSSINRNQKKKKMSERGRAKRQEIKAMMKDPEKREEAVIMLQKRPRNESQIRVRNRCERCGRSKGVLRKFALCRMCLRIAAMKGDVPGIKKASW